MILVAEIFFAELHYCATVCFCEIKYLFAVMHTFLMLVFYWMFARTQWLLSIIKVYTQNRKAFFTIFSTKCGLLIRICLTVWYTSTSRSTLILSKSKQQAQNRPLLLAPFLKYHIYIRMSHNLLTNLDLLLCENKYYN